MSVPVQLRGPGEVVVWEGEMVVGAIRATIPAGATVTHLTSPDGTALHRFDAMVCSGRSELTITGVGSWSQVGA